MTLSYSLRTLDELDGLRAPAPITPRWKAHEWPNASGIAKDGLGDEVHLAACRIKAAGRTKIGRHSTIWPVLSAGSIAKMRQAAGTPSGRQTWSRS